MNAKLRKALAKRPKFVVLVFYACTLHRLDPLQGFLGGIENGCPSFLKLSETDLRKSAQSTDGTVDFDYSLLLVSGP